MASSRLFKTPTRKYRGNFKSPLPTPAGSLQQARKTTESLRKEVQSLEAESRNLDVEIKQLQSQGYEESELTVHIDKLHEYNDIKDTGQMVLGRLAFHHYDTPSYREELYDPSYEDVLHVGECQVLAKATLEGVTTRSLYDKYGLKEDD